MKSLLLRPVLCLALACLLSAAVLAQQSATQSNPDKPLPAAPSQQKSEEEKKVEKREQSQRVLGVLPEFSVTNRQDAPPLTSAEKFHLFTKSTFDPVTFAVVGLQAGLSQATDEFPGYGQGAAGYGKRYGAAFADTTSSGFFANFFYPVLLKEDPRYFRLGEGSGGHRFAYALSRVLVCRTDKGRGHNSFNFSNVLGAFSSGGLSNAYYPEGDRGAALTVSRSAVALAYGGAGNLFTEFWPDIHRKLFKKKSQDSIQPATPPKTP